MPSVGFVIFCCGFFIRLATGKIPIVNLIFAFPIDSLRPLRVASGPSELYHLNDSYRVRTGRSPTTFQKAKSERLLFPKAVVQITEKSTI